MNRERPSWTPGPRGGAWLRLAALVGVTLLVTTCGGPTVAPPDLTLPDIQQLELVGLTGQTARDELTLANTGGSALSFETSVRAAAVDWLTVTPASGSLTAGAETTLTVEATCPTTPAELAAVLVLSTNDPDLPSAELPVRLTCTAAAAVAWRVVPASLGFLGTTGSTPAPQAVELTNVGTTTSDYTATTPAPWLGVQPAASSLAPGTSHTLTLTPTACAAEGRDSTEVTVAGGGARATIAVTRTCSDVPTPVLTDPTPNPLELAANVGESDRGTVVFANAGDATLDFQASAQTTSGGAWLSVVPTSGAVAPGTSQDLAVRATCPAAPGNYQGTLRLTTNDPAAPERNVAVALACAPQPPPAAQCEEIPEGEAGPTLRCAFAGTGVELRVPWQGRDLAVASLPLDGLYGLPATGGFDPTREAPLVRIAVTSRGSGDPVTDFAPPATLRVAYERRDVDAAEPRVDRGELALGTWLAGPDRWLVVGTGVRRNGFWVADPVGEAALVLTGRPADGVPRYAMQGTNNEGSATALLGRTPEELVLGWGGLPPDPDRTFIDFDACQPVENFGPGGVECTSAEAGLTVFVPRQQGGAVIPRVLAVPWNLPSTLEPQAAGGAPGRLQSDEGPVFERRLMNFLVVDDATGALLTVFDPPMDFEIRYAASDKDRQARQFLSVGYWDEATETYVVLGEGETSACDDGEGGNRVGCLWGGPVEAIPTSDPAFDGLFFRVDEPGGAGTSKFRFDKWGDRMVGLGN